MRNLKVYFLVGALVFLNPSQFVQGTEFQLFFLGGQSNMDGYGLVKELPDDLKSTQKGILIFHGNPAPDEATNGGLGIWTQLRPGHGANFRSDGNRNKYSPMFGPELTFSRSLQSMMPDKRIALIKYSRGGTSIHVDAARNFGCWDPDFTKGNGINQYDHFLKTVILAMSQSDIDGDGVEDKLVPSGILWMQGESDGSITESIAREYKANLKELMLAIQAAFRVDDIPVVIGRISDSGKNDAGKVWTFGDIIREEQASYVADFPPAALVTTTDKYGYSDPYHYDTKGYIDLGQQFAIEMYNLMKE